MPIELQKRLFLVEKQQANVREREGSHWSRSPQVSLPTPREMAIAWTEEERKAIERARERYLRPFSVLVGAVPNKSFEASDTGAALAARSGWPVDPPPGEGRAFGGSGWVRGVRRFWNSRSSSALVMGRISAKSSEQP